MATGCKLWPYGLRVLLVENDPFLSVIEQLLHQCGYQVTSCRQISEALSLVIKDQQRFDLVISDVFLPNEDGLLLLKMLAVQLGIPVVMISWNGETSSVMKYIANGACDYLIKPVRLQELKNIWQHVFRRVNGELNPIDGLRVDADLSFDSKAVNSFRKKSKTCFLSMEEAGEVINNVGQIKRTRLEWTSQLHRQFVSAVNMLGLDTVPKKILETMKVQELTREHVASHLQKYRSYLRKLDSSLPQDQDKWSSGQVSMSLSSNYKIDSTTLKSLQQFRALEKRNATYQDEISTSLNSMGEGGMSKAKKQCAKFLDEKDDFGRLNKQCDKESLSQAQGLTDINGKSPSGIIDHKMEGLIY